VNFFIHFMWILLFLMFNFDLKVYVCRPYYIFCFAFICLYVFYLFLLNSLGVDMHT